LLLKALINCSLLKRLTISIVVFILVLTPTLAFSGSFEEALQQGKDLGTQGIQDFNPQNIDQTLQQKGLCPANEITPKAGEAQGKQGSYSGYYTNPGGMSGAESSQAGQFVEDSYTNRQKFDLSRDSLFGNQCLQKDEEGRCLMWSASRDLITNAYPDCEKVVISRYGETREETCIGEVSSQTYDCEVRMTVSILTEEVQGPCSQVVIEEKPGQVYAVCRDYVDSYRVNKGRIDCFCGHYKYCKYALCSGCGGTNCDFCFWGDCPQDTFVVNSESELPPGAQYLGRGVTDIFITGGSGDRVAHGTLNSYYAKYRPSVIERVIISLDSTCGANFEKWLKECIVEDYQKCDSHGFNCVYLIRDAEETGQTVSEQCQNFASSIGNYQSQNCQNICPPEYEECKNDCSGGYTSCEEAKGGCRTDCDDAYSQCEAQCTSNRDSCLSGCGTDQSCKNNCQAIYNLCQTNCTQDKNTCYNTCETNYQNCLSCVSQCQSSFCQQQCETVTMDNYNICSLPNSSIGIRINGTIATKTPYRNFFKTKEKGIDITWQALFGGAGVREGLNDWWSKVKFLCNLETGNCQALRDVGCVPYSQRCLDSECNQVEYTYRCGRGGVIGYSVAYNCSGELRCMGTDCIDASYEVNTDFASAAAALEVLNQYRVDSSETSVFPGEEKECQSSPNNCCRKAGGGVSIGDYVNAARQTIQLYSYATGGASATWTSYANAFTYVLSEGQAGSLSGLLGTTVSDTLGTTTSVLYTSPGVVSYESANAMGVTVTSEGITEVTTVSAELVSTLATLATVISIALVVYSILKFIYDWMFQCKREDIITSSKLQLHLCHLVGYKKSKKLGVFTKKKNVYCCFNSILARIVHEQGRPQIGIGWGSASMPNCRGLTPEELASIDFSRVDLREYMQYVLHKTEISPEESQSIIDRIRQRYNY
jgi:conjugal transfer mating pair stabilization protein TraN